ASHRFARKSAFPLGTRVARGLLLTARMRSILTGSMIAALAACGATEAVDGGDNPFLADMNDDGKADSAYLNPDGAEVEIDLEGDVAAPAYKLDDAPAVLGQFAMTYFRKSETMYIESLAEDAGAGDRAEWLVDGTWYTNATLPAGAARTHWRLRGLNTVLLFSAAKEAKVGLTYTAKAPMKPFSVFADAGKTCADSDDHIGLDESVYWYRWEPDQTSCKIALQDLKVTVTKTFPRTQSAVYPEFDKLLADKKMTAVILFGQIDDGAITETETGMRSFKQYAGWLKAARYTEVTVPTGKRFEKLVNGNTVQIDLYSPREFSGLGDYANFANFQKALSEHEIVVWDGHSMLGASDFWERPTYPDTYQIFLYGGCLGYEYYVKPILSGKGGSWDNLDIMSSVIEVTASANEFAGPAIAKLVWALEHGNRASWRTVLTTVRNSVGDSTFGVSGVRDNCYSPYGSRCN
ncbi:MAG: hypothetical protein H0T79_18475, partial [Deltaproteobacteria bacterium]|nr:hypothetical protein [Deltaproteobacteria bacterium]